MSPSLMTACESDITEFCGGGVERGGKTIHCLMEHARPHFGNVRGRAVHGSTITKSCMIEVSIAIHYIVL